MGGVCIGLDDWGRGQAKLSFAGACSVVVVGGRVAGRCHHSPVSPRGWLVGAGGVAGR